MSINDLKDRLRGIPGIESLTMQQIGGRQVFGFNGLIAAVDPNASDDEIDHAIRNAASLVQTRLPQVNLTEPSSTMATIADQLKAARAQLADARKGAANAVAESASASGAVLQEVNKVLKEAGDLRAEVAELTNGGPA